MRLLFLCREQPWRDSTGGTKRNLRLASGLAQDHRVTMVTFSKPGVSRNSAFDTLARACDDVIEVPLETCVLNQTDRFEDSAAAARRLATLLSTRRPRGVQRWRSPAFVEALRQLRARNHVDAVFASRPPVAEMALEAGFDRVLVDLPDLESALMRRKLSHDPWYKSKPIDWGECLKLGVYDAMLPARYWRVSVCKEEDRRFFPSRLRRDVVVIPNGTDEHAATPADAEVRGEILFVGHLSYFPNVDAVLHFHREILPEIRRSVPEARFRIVGLRPDDAVMALDNGADCVVDANVENLDPYYARASIVVVPMRLGAGTKLKVVEALAYGKALVSTTFGAEGFDLRSGVDLITADNPQTFAGECARLLLDSAARRTLGASGRERVLARYSWAAIIREARAALE